MKKANGKNTKESFHFIGFKAAFDTVWRKALWKMLRSIGVDQNIVNIIEDMYDRTECAIQIDGKLTECKLLSNETDSLFIDGEEVERVVKFIFLGSVVPEVSVDVMRRIALASTAFGKLKKNVWSRNDLSLRIKSRLFYTLIIPIAIYACETWSW